MLLRLMTLLRKWPVGCANRSHFTTDVDIARNTRGAKYPYSIVCRHFPARSV